MNDFGQNLKYIRKKNNITQKQLATALEVAQSTIANYENNSRFPGEISLRQLADYLKVSVDYLLGLSAVEMNPPLHTGNAEGTPQDFDLICSEVTKHLLAGNEALASSLILSAYQNDADSLKLIENVYIPILQSVGTRWELGEISIGQEHYISNIIDRWIAMTSTPSQNQQKEFSAVFMVPSSEEHVLILKMIREYFRLNDWKTYYIGNNIPLSSLTSFINALNINLIVLSVSLSSHLNSVELLIKAIKSTPTKNPPKILVGGQAITSEKQAKEQLGADYYITNVNELNPLILQIEKKQ